jgi:ATP-dependent DNA helicase RecG
VAIAPIKMRDDQVGSLLGIEEGQFVDLKAIDVSPASITSGVCAFANTSGGELFIGRVERIGKSGPERARRAFPNQEAANGLIQALEPMSPLAVPKCAKTWAYSSAVNHECSDR